jgi:hypothetical protein
MLATVTPLPTDETTPPVTKMYLAIGCSVVASIAYRAAFSALDNRPNIW